MLRPGIPNKYPFEMLAFFADLSYSREDEVGIMKEELRKGNSDGKGSGRSDEDEERLIHFLIHNYTSYLELDNAPHDRPCRSDFFIHPVFC